jgi:DNA-binding NarL/FixJ family response regulator
LPVKSRYLGQSPTLSLSQKTVESHIRNMFRKVSVSSRVELARAVEQADRAGAA